MIARLSPLALTAAVLPAMIGLLFLRDLQRPAVFLTVAVLMFIAARDITWRTKTRVVVALIAVATITTGLLALTIDTDRLSDEQSVRTYAFATGLRVAAVTALALVTGFGAGTERIGRALVQQARVPARIGYVFRLSSRMVPRIRQEIATIRITHRARGQVGGRLRRAVSIVVPVVAGHVRYAERVALAMDARGFADARGRTERVQERWRWFDTLWVVIAWVFTIAIFFYLPLR